MKNKYKLSTRLFLRNLPHVRILFLFLILIMGAAFTASAQGASDKRITGRVESSKGVPLQGATISLKNSTRSTTSNAEGNFSIMVSENDILVISFVGYNAQEIPVAGKTTFNITMQEQASTMSDVVIVGYKSQKRSSLTGAISSVNMEDVEKRRVPDVAQLLQGQVSGVQVTQSTGAPGDDIAIRIRGEGTIGNNSPLFIVDGTPSRDITFLNPNDIQSMTVLKDASAAAIYGSRASAGVIVITTKSGREGKTAIDINYYNGIQQVANLPKMLNTTQYMNKM
ncbi:MAG: TonB-dependent receptor plug domain-containing protein [Ginsengibacter sp.]